MTLSTAANKGCARRGAAGWLVLAASPTFALMAWVAASETTPMALCSAGSSLLPLDGMQMMYALMSLFHLAPWLTLVSGRNPARR
jgi:hypothetical protein